MELSTNSEFVLTGGQTWQNPQKNHSVCLWHRERGELLGKFTSEVPFRGMAFSPDNQSFYLGNHSGEMKKYSIGDDNKVMQTWQFPDQVWSIEESPVAPLIAIGQANGVLEIRSLEGDQETRSKMFHDGGITDLAFSHNGELLASASIDNTCRIWDCATGHQIGPAFRHLDRVNKVEFSPDGKSVITASDDGTAKLWHLPDTDPKKIDQIIEDWQK